MFPALSGTDAACSASCVGDDGAGSGSAGHILVVDVSLTVGSQRPERSGDSVHCFATRRCARTVIWDSHALAGCTTQRRSVRTDAVDSRDLLRGNAPANQAASTGSSWW